MNEFTVPPATHLKDLLAQSSLAPLSEEQLQRFATFLSLIIRWNTRMNLTAVRSQEGIVSRHFLESIACAQALPSAVTTLLDFGSGAGFPGVPVSICRPEIAVTLAESQGKKAAFLHEAVRALGLTATVHSGRAEEISSAFDCVVLRAVDRMPRAVSAAAKLVHASGFLGLLTTTGELPVLSSVCGPAFEWSTPIPTPGGRDRIFALATRISAASWLAPDARLVRRN